MKKNITIIGIIVVFVFSSCKNNKKTEVIKENKFETNLKKADFTNSINGKQVSLYYIKANDISVAFTNYGARIVGLWIPDKNYKMTDVVVGFNNTEAYISSTEPYFGATIGRVGNRIAKGTFTVDNKTYQIPKNNGENSLHGGTKGFQDVVWDVKQIDEKTLSFTYNSPDGEEGFPGNLKVDVIYSVDDNKNLKIEYSATTDKKTPVNLTNHAFFNLNGEGSGTILNHKVFINSDQFTPVDSGLLPYGYFKNVLDTPFDFTSFHTIGERIETNDEQLSNGKGYDHNFVLNNINTVNMHPAATVIGDKSGIVMEIITKEPGLQFYSGNFMQGQNTFKSGTKDDFRTAFAMETQHFPDSPNQPNFPSIILEPENTYHSITEYKFSIKK